MPEEIVMPRLSDTMEEGTIAQWIKHEGDAVHRGDVILEVETDKATMPLEAYADGVIQRILQQEGTTVPVGAVIGIMGKPGETVAPDASEAPARAPAAGSGGTTKPSGETRGSSSNGGGGGQRPSGNAPAAPSEQPQAPAAPNGNGAGGRVRATPLARNLARQHNIDLIALASEGTGPGGRIVKLDIERFMSEQAPAAAAAAAPAAQGPVSRPPVAAAAPEGGDDVEMRTPSRIQQVAARRLLESKTTVPHFYVTNEVDMAAAAEFRTHLTATFGEQGKVTYNHLVIRACAVALRAMPEVNTSWRDGQFAVHKRVNVGVAVDTPNGLLVPVIADADRKGLLELAAVSRDMAARARDGKLTPNEMQGGTFTISSLGMFDVEEFQAIINPPESAILAVGSITDKAVVIDGAVVVRPRMKLTLSVDHRVIPGVPAAQFLQKVKQLLQEPLRLAF